MFSQFCRKIEKIYYNNEQFQPKIIGLFFNPFYFARKGLYKGVLRFSNHLSGKILDIGCGIKPYQNFFKASEYIGLEIDTPKNRQRKKADVFYDGKTLPFENEHFDSVICSQVIEHVFSPDKFLEEVNRVLTVDGKLLLTVPFLWDEHEQPYDYARYSSFGIKYLLEKKGFEIITAQKICNGAEVIFQLINCYIYKVIKFRNKIIALPIIWILTAPVNIIGYFLSMVLPKNEDLYLDNILLAKKNKYV